jgi:hypothetical protein
MGQVVKLHREPDTWAPPASIEPDDGSFVRGLLNGIAISTAFWGFVLWVAL